MPPWERRAVVWISRALHARLVAVIDTWHARHKADQPEHHLQEPLSRFALARGQAQFSALRPRHLFAVRACKHVQNARAVVRAEQVEEPLRKRRRIVFIERIHSPFERARRNPPGQKLQRSLAQRVVHHAVQCVAQAIAAHLPIADLVGRVLPHLAENKRILPLRAYVFAQLTQVIHRQLVGHVQPPAGASGFQPAARYRIGIAQEIFAHARRVFVQLRHVAEAPPAFIIVRPCVEEEPVEPLRIPAAARSEKIGVFRARVAENAVEENANAALFSFRAKRGKISLVPQQRIDSLPVDSIVAVIARRLEAGVEIERRHTQALEIRQLFSDAAQTAAVKIERLKIARLRVGTIWHGRIPREHVPLSGAAARVRIRAETIRKNLIKHRAARPFRHAERRIVHRHLERARAAPHRRALAPQTILRVTIPEKMPCGPDMKIIPEKAGRFRQRDAHLVQPRVVLRRKHIVKVLLAIPCAQEHLIRLSLFFYAQAKRDFRPAGLRAGRRPIERLPAVVIAVHIFPYHSTGVSRQILLLYSAIVRSEEK